MESTESHRSWLLYFNNTQYIAQQRLIMTLICLTTPRYVRLVSWQAFSLCELCSNSVRNEGILQCWQVPALVTILDYINTLFPCNLLPYIPFYYCSLSTLKSPKLAIPLRFSLRYFIDVFLLRLPRSLLILSILNVSSKNVCWGDQIAEAFMVKLFSQCFS